MNEIVYLILTKTGVSKMVKREPARDPGEYVVAVNVTVPDDVFKRTPVPVVQLELSGPQLGVPNVIVDGESATTSRTDANAQHGAAIQQLAVIFKAARASTDPAMRRVSDKALADLIAAGVDVRIVMDDERPGQ